LFYRTLTLSFVLLLLTACGGGGGGGSSPAPTPAPAPTSSAGNDALSVDEDTTAEIDVTANDTNVSASSAAITTEPANGIATMSNGVITYTPANNFNGSDTIAYSIDSNNNTGSHQASLTITVNSINDAPLAADDTAATNINTSLEITPLDNDLDVEGDSLTVEIIEGATNGSTAVLPGGIISYAPILDFIGQDEITYQAVDSSGAISNTATITITITGLAQTNLLIQELTIPTTGYSDVPTTEPGEFILASPLIEFEVSDNAVSFVVSLIGSSVQQLDSLSIIGVRNPQGTVLNFRDTVFCDLGLCTIQLPKRPGIIKEGGTWALRVGTFASSTDFVDFSDYQLQLVSRIGPEPAVDSRTVITVKPFLTGSVSIEDIDAILTRLTDMVSASDIDVLIDPITVVENARFSEVDVDFRDADTRALVLMGDPMSVNVFFLEGFSNTGGGGLLGISGGLPGTLGLASEYNGVLVNGLATFSVDKETYHRTTAEFTFHEISHLLGLYHTTEADFSEHDILNDTPNCLQSQDTNSNGRADSRECLDGLNLMFWQNDLTKIKMSLTTDQKAVIRSSVVSTEIGN
jgi:hypothetical protein